MLYLAYTKPLFNKLSFTGIFPIQFLSVEPYPVHIVETTVNLTTLPAILCCLIYFIYGPIRSIWT